MLDKNGTAEALKQRLAQALKASGLKKSELARRCSEEAGEEATPQTVGGWFKTGRMDKRWLPIVEKVTGQSLGFSAFGNVDPAAVGAKRVPVLSYVQAGRMTEAVMPYALDDITEFVMAEPRVSDRVFALRIKGESMLPRFREGDVVIVDPDLAPRPGSFVVAKNGSDEACFKKYRPRGVNAEGVEVFELVPLNEDYPTIRSDVVEVQIIATMIEHRQYYR